MMMRLLALVSLLAGLPAAAMAQIGSQGGPMDITAEHLEVFDTERRAVFSGEVDAAQGDANLRSDRLEVFFAQRTSGSGAGGSSWGEVDRVIATGNVFYVTPDEVARGERAVYELTEETIVMTGNVVLTRGRDVITGNCLVVDLATNNSRVNPPGCGGQAEDAGTDSSGRVRLILYPTSDGDEDDEDGGDAEG
ncbi:LptA/OstA family protein [Hyphobacterium sp. HN65]|uniref:LptA/OstA family protein n=1 Tax=Hyphobacterium lacteum TaxID=3116575 RepID=A0ABU7LSS0_9PROT|nr:LptA/OstA family protein [Hyphobacterium sp. HN65]MEE2526968.1 LptA/OstA family protein [Hyphobacterium sp. HN65]